MTEQVVPFIKKEKGLDESVIQVKATIKLLLSYYVYDTIHIPQNIIINHLKEDLTKHTHGFNYTSRILLIIFDDYCRGYFNRANEPKFF